MHLAVVLVVVSPLVFDLDSAGVVRIKATLERNDGFLEGNHRNSRHGEDDFSFFP